MGVKYNNLIVLKLLYKPFDQKVRLTVTKMCEFFGRINLFFLLKTSSIFDGLKRQYKYSQCHVIERIRLV